MGRKVAKIDLDEDEYSTLSAIADKKGLTISVALHEAAVRWAREELGIDPKDPLFSINPRNWAKDAEKASRGIDDSSGIPLEPHYWSCGRRDFLPVLELNPPYYVRHS